MSSFKLIWALQNKKRNIEKKARIYKLEMEKKQLNRMKKN